MVGYKASYMTVISDVHRDIGGRATNMANRGYTVWLTEKTSKTGIRNIAFVCV